MEYIHCKQIVNGRLYNTSASYAIFEANNQCYFITPKGNYFSAIENRTVVPQARIPKIKNGLPLLNYKFVCRYSNIRPETLETVKEALAKYDADRYQDMFGEVEHA